MASRIRRLPGSYYGRHPYLVSRSLDGLVPGRREVGKLIVKRLGPDAADGLRPLQAFRDLRELELEWTADVDLDPLVTLSLEQLRIEYGHRLDLSPIARLRGLKRLDIIYPRECSVPPTWSLPPSLTGLALIAERPAAPLLREMVAAIPWASLNGLEALAVGGEMNSIDLGFLAELPSLQVLDVRQVRHRGSGPSPLDPPFPGLSLDLVAGLSEVDDPESAQAAWTEHRRAAGRSGPSMNFRQLWWPDGYDDEAAEAHPESTWDILPPEADGDVWQAYGSLYLAAEGRDGETEHDALRAARRKVREADSALLRRLDFDPEANGTGIYARTREDLEAALRILGLGGGSRGR